MMEVLFLICLGIVWIIFAMVQDLKTREISNWVSLSLVVFALGFRFFWSLFEGQGSWMFFYQGLLGFGIFIAIGMLFYYSRVFAGGDAKLMMALGAVLPFSSNFYVNVNLFFVFIMMFLLSGSLYGIFSSIVFAYKNKKSFNKEFLKLFRKNKKLIFIFLALGLISLALSFLYSVFIALGIFLVLIPYVYLWAKAVDRACMIRKVSPEKLTVGDWLYKDVRLGKKFVRAKWEGLNEDEIKLLRKKKREVLVRYGIQFTPVFLISFLGLVVWYLFL